MTAAPDLTRLVERLSAQLAREGVPHPVAAAVALACRGSTGLDVHAFAEKVGLDASIVSDSEAGRIPFGSLPAAIVAGHEGLDLLALADLDSTNPSGRGAPGLDVGDP